MQLRTAAMSERSLLSAFTAWAGWTAYAKRYRRRLQCDIDASDSDDYDPDFPVAACVFIQVPRDPAGERFVRHGGFMIKQGGDSSSSVWKPSSLDYRRRRRD